MDILYSESNRTLSAKGICAVAMVFIAICAFLTVSYFYPSWNPGKPPLDLVSLTAFYLLFLILFILMAALRVTVVVDSREVRIKCIGTKIIPKEEIMSVEICEIKAMRRFGGYGVRWRPGKVGYTSDSIKDGIRILTRDGRETYIFSMHPQRLSDAVNARCDPFKI